MKQAEQWDLILKTNTNPCFIADVETYEMIYVNDEYKKLLPSSEKTVGRKFYEIIQNDNAADFQDIRLDWTSHNVIERQLDNRRLGLSFFVQLTIMRKENVVF